MNIPMEPPDHPLICVNVDEPFRNSIGWRCTMADENENTAASAGGNPLLADHLDGGLLMLDLHCGEFDAARL